MKRAILGIIIILLIILLTVSLTLAISQNRHTDETINRIDAKIKMYERK